MANSNSNKKQQSEALRGRLGSVDSTGVHGVRYSPLLDPGPFSPYFPSIQQHLPAAGTQQQPSPLVDFSPRQSPMSISSAKKSPMPPHQAQQSPAAFATPFGSSLFAPGWRPSPTSDTFGRPPVVAAAFNGNLDNSSIQSIDPRPSVAKALDYLGMDEDDVQAYHRQLEAPITPTEEQHHQPSILLTGGMRNLSVDTALSAIKRQPVVPHIMSSIMNSFEGASRSLWVGNVDPSLDEADLKALFKEFGQIESMRVLPDKECAFVNYVNIEDSIKAMERMQGARVGSCVIKLGYGKSDSSSEAAQVPSRSLWVGNLSAKLSSEDMTRVFSTYGPIESFKTLPHRNCGFVNYFQVEHAAAAREHLNGTIVDGMPLRISFSKTPADKVVTPSSPHMKTSFRPPCSHAVENAPTAPKSAVDASAKSVSASTIAPILLLPDSAKQSTTVTSVVTDTDAPALPDASQYVFASEIEPLPLRQQQQSQIGKKPTMDANRLREYRRKLEQLSVPPKEVDQMFLALSPYFVELATDPFGNTVAQKLIEKASDKQRLKLVEKCAPHLPAIAVHKNGTWVVQKLLECAKTTTALQLMLGKLKSYTPALLTDPFGNYVIQGIVRLGTHRNQFVFDTMYLQCLEIGQVKFGARAMRACLESPYATKKQQKLVAMAVVKNALTLITNPNGILLLHWIVDSPLEGRYHAVLPNLLPKVSQLAHQKLAHVVLLKILTQNVEPNAANELAQALFSSEASVLASLFGGSTEVDGGEQSSIIPSELGSAILFKCVEISTSQEQRDSRLALLGRAIQRYLRNNNINHGQFFSKLVSLLDFPSIAS